jgi:hypothetical protein
VLEDAGLVSVRREGRGSHYRVNRQRLLQVVGGWLKNLTAATPAQTWTSSGRRSTHTPVVRENGKTPKLTVRGTQS